MAIKRVKRAEGPASKIEITCTNPKKGTSTHVESCMHGDFEVPSVNPNPKKK